MSHQISAVVCLLEAAVAVGSVGAVVHLHSLLLLLLRGGFRCDEQLMTQQLRGWRSRERGAEEEGLMGRCVMNRLGTRSHRKKREMNTYLVCVSFCVFERDKE